MDTCLKHVSRDSTFDILKGICILLVLAGHVIQYIIYANNKLFFEDFYFKFIYGFHMPLFMLICGYFSSTSIVKKGYLAFIKKRILTMAVPIIFFGILPILTKQIFTKSFNMGSIISGVSELWFLWVAMALSVSVSFLKLRLDLLHICCSFLACVVLSMPSRPLFFFMLPYFICGMYLNKSKIEFFSRGSSIVFNLILYIILMSFFDEQTYIYTSGINPVDSPNGFWGQIIINIHRYFAGFFGSLVMLGIVNKFSRMKCDVNIVNLIRRGFAYLGTLSLEIYVLQHFVLEKIAFRFNQKMIVHWGG